jgi:hypothetical protein
MTGNYVLYHNRFSICSMMVRYTLASRGEATDQGVDIVVEEREVDLYHGEQLKEEFLCEINRKGQVSMAGSKFHVKQFRRLYVLLLIYSRFRSCAIQQPSLGPSPTAWI